MYGTGIGTSLMLIAVGAVLALAVDYQVTGLDINAVGIILMVVGLVGLMFSLAFLGEGTWFGRRRQGAYDTYSEPHTHTHTREIVRDVPPDVSETTTTHTTRRI
jgi:hypothetical protein